MITSGSPRSSSKRTEVIDVITGRTCLDLPDLPVDITSAVGANLQGTPIICGGYLSGKLLLQLQQRAYLSNQLRFKSQEK